MTLSQNFSNAYARFGKNFTIKVKSNFEIFALNNLALKFNLGLMLK